jgi:hypothetical protein
MVTKRSIKSIMSNIIFLLGIIAGLFLAGISIWADYEAVRYFFTGAHFDSFRGMRCPILASRSEAVTISATIENPSDRTVRPFYRVEVSGPVGRMLREQTSITPRQTEKVEWIVNGDDVDLSYFIMTKITVLPFAGLPTREAVCGIFVLNLDWLTGQQAMITLLAVSLFGIVFGLVIWERQMKTANKGFIRSEPVRRAIGLVVLLAMLSGLAGWWLAGIIFCALAILLFVIMLSMSLNF